MEPVIDKLMLVNGTQVNYFFVCPPKLWLFSHFVRMEQYSDKVAQGRLLHETSYKREKEQLTDNKIATDFIKKGASLVLH